MRDRDVLILSGGEVAAALAGRELEVIETVEAAYKVHAGGDSVLPHSLFLRFPDEERNRIIALPAYLGRGFDVAGMKWVSSFPLNTRRGLDRASAVIVLNSAETGRPEVLMEGSVVSAKRTAASAALAVRALQGGCRVESVAVMGCGPINLEVVRFLLTSAPGLARLKLFDIDAARAGQFRDRCRELDGRLAVEVVRTSEALFAESDVVSMATTALRPHVSDLSACRPGATVLHVSLRDLTPEVILSSDNVVDDVDHVCRSQTSVHLAEGLAGGRDFIRCTLPDILNGVARPKQDPAAVSIFSPFGLGVLDLAVGQLASRLAAEGRHGTVIEQFLPAPYAGGR
jgi:ornithine cyclodeaminase